MNEQHETNDINVNENEGDFVIKELDVYLSKSLINNLYLFQVSLILLLISFASY